MVSTFTHVDVCFNMLPEHMTPRRLFLWHVQTSRLRSDVMVYIEQAAFVAGASAIKRIENAMVIESEANVI